MTQETESFDFNGESDQELLEGTNEDSSEELIDEVNEEVVEDQAEETTAEEHEEKQPKRDPVIPRARFDEVHSKWQAERDRAAQLEARLSELSATQQAPNADVDLDDLEEQAFNAMLEGDAEQAKQIRRQINTEVRRQAADEAEARVYQREQKKRDDEARNESARQAAALEAVVPQVVAKYPWLDSLSGEGDEDAINEVLALRDGYAAKGTPLADALIKAVGVIAKARGETVAPVQITDKRKQLALVEAAKTAALQPAYSGGGVGNRAMPIGKNVLDNQDAWEKAEDAERKQLLA